MRKLGIIDADGFIFFAAWGYRDQMTLIGLGGAQKQLDRLVENCLKAAGVTHYIGFFGSSGKKNFRHGFATIRPYKGTRSDEPWMKYFKPKLRAYMAKKWGFYEVGDLEADDAAIIAHHQFKDDWDIIHISEDKDQKQLGEFTRLNPNARSNPKKKIEHFTHYDGRKAFWCQMLTGDSTDNIQGVTGVGPKSDYCARINALDKPSEEQMYEIVREAYTKTFGGRYLYHMLENYILLCMMTVPSFDYPKDVEPREFKGRAKVNTPEQLVNL